MMEVFFPANNGKKLWNDEGREITSTKITTKKGTFVIKDVDGSLEVSIKDVALNIRPRFSNVVLIQSEKV